MSINDILDYERVTITTINGEKFIGKPIAICYSDETESGENEIDIETEEGIIGFLESNIKKAEEIKDGQR